MALDARKHTIPGEAEAPRRSAFDDLAKSVNDVIPVANATERDQVYADLVAAGHVPSSTPVLVDRLDVGVIERNNGSGWAPVEATLMGRVPVSEALVGVDTAITSVITVPSLPFTHRVVVWASGRSGNAASARNVAWGFDSHPGGVTVAADPVTRVPAGGGQYATVSATETLTVPANTSATFRVMYRGDNNGFNTGAVMWMRGRA